MDSNQIIPFGKYKGKPISVLQNDKEYLEWVMSQGWFIEKFQSLHTIIINNFETQNKTPEHNQLQSIFLDDNFIKKIIFKIYGIDIDEKIKTAFVDIGPYYRWDVCFSYNYICEKVKDENKTIFVYTDYLKHKIVFECNFYNYFFDVFINIEYDRNKSEEERFLLPDFKNNYKDAKLATQMPVSKDGLVLAIELKPIIGDDYSSILRKIPHNSIVITKKYDGSVSFENVKKMFESKNVKLYLLSELTD